MANIIDVLKERGFVDSLTSEEIRELTKNPTTVYCGFDPTADSLHLGNLVAMMGLAWFQRFGHTPIAIVGGATGMIGDPGGKTTERQLLDQKTIEHNLKGIKKNLEALLDFTHPTAKAVILNNYDWFKEISFVDFLRNTGSFFRVGTMLGKDSVRLRLQSEEGMSFTEFSYQLLQGYDFLHLHQNYHVKIQLGGSDQWGNITAGTELIRKKLGEVAFGMTFPLLTKSDGQKFGKSEKGAIWLSPEKLSAYEFYQHLIRTEDADVSKLMRILTFMDMQEIKYYEKLMQDPTSPPRLAQKKLAEEITRLIHGEAGLKKAQNVTEGIAPGSKTKLDADLLEEMQSDIAHKELTLDEVLNKKLVDLLVETGLQTSKTEAKKLIRGGGAYLNNIKITDEAYSITNECLIENRLLLLSIGKKNKLLVKILSN